MAAGLSDSEPSPRWGHISAPVDGKLYVWGGHTKKFSSQAKRKLASTLHVFNPIMESWKDQSTTGVPPPGLFGGACASAGDCLYVYGGSDGPYYYSSLHKLDTKTSVWSLLASDGPIRMVGGRMIEHNNNLLLFGGYGVPSESGAEFVKNSHLDSGIGWSNKLYAFDLKKGERMICRKCKVYFPD